MKQNQINLILDIEADTIRFGYSGDAAPRLTTNSYYAKLQKKEEYSQMSMEHKPLIERQEYMFGDNLLNDSPQYDYMHLLNPENGILPTEKFYDFYIDGLCSSISLDSKALPLIVSEPN